MASAGQSECSQVCEMDVSPGGTKYWIPSCDESVKPFKGQRFERLEHGVAFYRQYGSVVGFDVRRSTVRKNRDSVVVLNYLVCSREGFKQAVGDSSARCGASDAEVVAEKRRRVSNRVGCEARIVLKMVVDGSYVVHFVEHRHNHSLCSEVAKTFLRVNRKLDYGHQNFLVNCARANIGPNRSFRLYKQFAGSYAKIGATTVDFKNLKRDLMAYIVTADAHMVVSKYVKKVESCPDYFFAHDVDSQDQLRRVFWADPVARANFASFGDVVSFDATYGTNRYSMVFVPFTGVDNHKKSVTFAVGLIANEDIDSYVWLLENVKRAMGRVPACTVTDQDPSMRAAVAKVFDTTRHRFCMWHIMSKVGEKVGPVLAKDEGFRRALNAVVWNETLTVNEFERMWQSLMETYDLVDHRWFRQMYDLRSFWIPAFFHDVNMGGLLRTTSRSEAENSVFGSCTNHHATLSELFDHFKGAIDAQRHAQAKLNAACEGSFPTLKTPLLIERHAATVYTINVFYDVQAEVFGGCFSCRIVTSDVSDVVCRYEIEDGCGALFDVRYDCDGPQAECSCKLFHRIGLLCSHIFLVFKDRRVQSIPLRYVLSRWTKDASVRLSGMDHMDNGGALHAAVSEAWLEFYSLMGLASKNVEDVLEVTKAIKALNSGLGSDNGSVPQSIGRKGLVEAVFGTSVPEEVCIRPPAKSKNKGSGKRIKSQRELALEKASREGRECKTCHLICHHDSRNCPLRQTKSNSNAKHVD